MAECSSFGLAPSEHYTVFTDSEGVEAATGNFADFLLSFPELVDKGGNALGVLIAMAEEAAFSVSPRIYFSFFG